MPEKKYLGRKRYWLPIEAFLVRVIAPTDIFRDCWEWRGRKVKGYGLLRRNVLAHRFSYMIHRGPIPSELTIDHLCRNKGCVNPWHMEVVTVAENTRRATPGNSKKTHCRHGHPYDGENTYTYRTKTGTGRGCRVCRRANQLAYTKRREAVGA